MPQPLTPARFFMNQIQVVEKDPEKNRTVGEIGEKKNSHHQDLRTAFFFLLKSIGKTTVLRKKKNCSYLSFFRLC